MSKSSIQDTQANRLNEQFSTAKISISKSNGQFNIVVGFKVSYPGFKVKLSRSLGASGYQNDKL